MKQWLFNPFMYMAGTKALVIGWCIMLASAVICFFTKTHFDGIIDVHSGLSSATHIYFLEALIDWALPVILFYIAGLIFSASAIRLIDVAGTFALARWVMIIPAIIGIGVSDHVPPPNATIDEVLKFITPAVIIVGLLTVLIAIWMIALMYNAFRVSCNLKGGKATGIFIVTLLIAEILSNYIIHHFVIV